MPVKIAANQSNYACLVIDSRFCGNDEATFEQPWAQLVISLQNLNEYQIKSCDLCTTLCACQQTIVPNAQIIRNKLGQRWRRC